MQNKQDIQCIGTEKTIVFTKKQAKDVDDFKNLLKDGTPEFAFEGSLLEGVSFLKGGMQIVEAVNH